MDLNLKGRVALVTGGSKGIGASIVRQLAQEGVRVIICARPSQAMADLVLEISAGGWTCIALPVDVLNPAAISAVVELAARQWGGIDILINNVGGAERFGGFEELKDEDWLRAHEFNVMSVVRFTRSALPHLRGSTLRRIINVSSISAVQPGYYNPHYTVTKAAVLNLGKYLANALANENILVNTICPGPVKTEAWEMNVRKVSLTRKISDYEARELVEK